MAKKLPRSLSVRPVKLQGQLEETFYKKSDDGQRYRHSGSSDLWLIETKDGTRGTLSLPRRGQGWMTDRGTTWLTNPPREGNPMAAKKGKKRRPPKGFKSWKTFMRSIRPNKPKRKVTVAKAKKRKTAKRPGTAIVLVNRPKGKRRGHRRRNPNLGAYVNSAVGMVLNGAIGGLVIVATEAGTRLARKRLLNMPAGTMLAGATEVGMSTTAGLIVGHMVPGKIGERLGQLIVDAGFASVTRATLKQSKLAFVSDALADDGPAPPYVVRNGRVVRRGMGNYVPGRAMGGYVAGSGGRATQLGAYVPGTGAAETAAATSFINDMR